MMDRYEACRILNLTPDATIEQIKQSYHELSKKYHPDHNQDRIAHDIFIMFDKAYKYLLDDDIPASKSITTNSAPNSRSVPNPTMNKDSFNHMFEEFMGQLGGHNFDLDDCKLTSMQNICTKHQINIKCISSTSHRPINKTKDQLFRDIVKLPQYQELKTKQYDQLTSIAQEKHLSVTKTKNNKIIPLSILELILGIISASD